MRPWKLWFKWPALFQMYWQSPQRTGSFGVKTPEGEYDILYHSGGKWKSLTKEIVKKVRHHYRDPPGWGEKKEKPSNTLELKINPEVDIAAFGTEGPPLERRRLKGSGMTVSSGTVHALICSWVAYYWGT
jgi:hypothetical protein